MQGGFGVVISIENTGLQAIGKCKDVDFPEQDRAVVDVTAHDSPGGYAERLPTGKKELTEFSMTLFWDVLTAGTQHAVILSAFSADSIAMSIADPDSDEVIAFTGIIKTIGRVSRQDDAYQARIVVTPTGAPTIT